MAVPRSQSRPGTVRGSLVRGDSRSVNGSRSGSTAEPVADPSKPRSVLDYALQRRTAIRTLYSGGALTSEFCDADPYLMRAARFHGEPTDDSCPACRVQTLVHVTYAFGDALGPSSGGALASAQLPELAREHAEFRVYVVEVCQGCEWNFLVMAFTLGHGAPRQRSRRSRGVMEP
ncbi:MAG: DUF5318 family protein [Actinomycetales bacterium]|nr:DUF5318 family protein [Actinomycetales bacterium]